MRARLLVPLLFAFPYTGCGFRAVQAPDLSTNGDGKDMAAALDIAVAPPADLTASTLRGVLGAGAISVSAVDLTQRGTRDWEHWGYLTASGVDRKANVTAALGAFSELGSAAVQYYDNNTTNFSWSDGDLHPSVAGTTTGVYIVGVNEGFRLTVPADVVEQTLELYVGGFHGRGALHAEVSDAPLLGYDDASFSRDDAGLFNATYTLRFRAASAGQTLTVTWSAQSLSQADGNVTLQAAALR
jgi:hypothetical protein